MLILTLRVIVISPEVDLVAGGTAWWHRGKDNFSTIKEVSIIDEAYMDTILTTPPGSPPQREPCSLLDSWVNVCGFLKPSESA